MKLPKGVLLVVAIPVLVVPLFAQDAPKQFRAKLTGPGEVPLSLTAATGSLQMTASDDDTSVHFVLEYQGLETHVRFAHIHIGKRTDLGGVTVFFCGGGGRPDCPDESGTVEGDFTADNVIGVPAQTLAPNDLATLLAAIRSGETYANVHTDDSPGGEIRGQIFPVKGEGQD